MDAWMWVVLAVAVVGVILLLRWAFRWRDPDWSDSEQQKALLWSKRGSGER